eukprot:scaffold8453_cov131-Amphora_coffeaeformis.AAC.3
MSQERHHHNRSATLSSLSPPPLLFLVVVVVVVMANNTATTSSCALSSSTMTTNTPTSNIKIKTTTLGAGTLRTIVRAAAERDEAATLDLQGITWLEHINLVVESKPLAQRFYLDILGLSADTSPSFHCNLGQQQFHLAQTDNNDDDDDDDGAQRVTGSIGLTVPNLASLRDRLTTALTNDREIWKNTQLAIVMDDHDDSGFMTITCPWGNCLHLYDLQADTERLQQQQQQQQQLDKAKKNHPSPHKMVNLHAPGGAYAAQRMAIRGNPGIRYLEVACPPGTAKSIAEFYQNMLGCTVSEHNDPSCFAIVCVGPGVHLIYVEQETLTENQLQAMKGVHICIYVSDFAGLYQRLQSKGLIWTNPRFTHLDSCDTWEQAKASRTLRFKDIVDLSSNDNGRKKIFELEHETRPMRHGQYLKVPFYEPK